MKTVADLEMARTASRWIDVLGGRALRASRWIRVRGRRRSCDFRNNGCLISILAFVLVVDPNSRLGIAKKDDLHRFPLHLPVPVHRHRYSKVSMVWDVVDWCWKPL